MSDTPTNNDDTVLLLKIQAMLAGAYDLSRTTDKHFLSYLIKMARMEVRAQFDPGESSYDWVEKPDDLDRS